MATTPSAEESNSVLLATIANAQAPRPKKVRPVIIIGAGGIVRDAHLPAYRKAGFRVTGIYDLEAQRAETLAARYGIPRVFQTLEDAAAAATPDTIFDVAVPASSSADVLRWLPEGHGILVQKPMGEDLAQARIIRDLCRAK